jgi:hypothetical protein
VTREPGKRNLLRRRFGDDIAVSAEKPRISCTPGWKKLPEKRSR